MTARAVRTAPPTPTCPTWLEAAIELPLGYDAATHRRSRACAWPASCRRCPAIRGWAMTIDDGRAELHLRFALDQVVALLTPGANTLIVSGRTPARDFQGDGAITRHAARRVPPDLTPRTLEKGHLRPFGIPIAVRQLTLSRTSSSAASTRGASRRAVAAPERRRARPEVVSDQSRPPDREVRSQGRGEDPARRQSRPRSMVSGTLGGIPFTPSTTFV